MKANTALGLAAALVSFFLFSACGGGGGSRAPEPIEPGTGGANPQNPYHWTPLRGLDVEGGEAYAEVSALLGAPDIRELGHDALDESGFPLREYASPPYSGAIQRSPPTEYPEEPLSLEIALQPANWNTYIFPLPSEFGMSWVPDTGNGWAFSAMVWETAPGPYHWADPYIRRSYGMRVVYINGAVYISESRWYCNWQLSGKKLICVFPGYLGELERE